MRDRDRSYEEQLDAPAASLATASRPRQRASARAPRGLDPRRQPARHAHRAFERVCVWEHGGGCRRLPRRERCPHLRALKNPTVHALEARLANLERTEDACATASGMAALSGAVLRPSCLDDACHHAGGGPCCSQYRRRTASPQRRYRVHRLMFGMICEPRWRRAHPDSPRIARGSNRVRVTLLRSAC